MDEKTERLFYTGAGPLAAILLGVALIPLRGFTSAANFSYAFVALTIVIGEFGGRTAAVVTALASALSLDFFLTQPYLRLEIHDKHDVVAFLGLAACGLLAAALASVHGRGARALSRKRLDLLQSAVAELPQAGPLESRLGRILEAARLTFPVTAAIVRDRGNRTIAYSEGASARPVPDQALDAQTLLPTGLVGRVSADASVPLPAEGARLALVIGRRPLGWLDLYGNGVPASRESRQALSAVARAVAALLVDAER
jgi:two-component system sensor histidine kinase KdpD